MKPTNTAIAKYYGLTRQTIATYKKVKPETYEALKRYFIFKKEKQCKEN